MPGERRGGARPAGPREATRPTTHPRDSQGGAGIMARRIGSEFMRLTRHAHLDMPDQQLGRPAPPLTEPPRSAGAAVDLPPAMEWPRSTGAEVTLPSPEETAAVAPAFHALASRRTSLRRFADRPLSLGELSFLLWCTQGVKEARQQATLRTVPSAGARHALETLLWIRHVEGVPAGLHYFDPLEHRLLALGAPPDLEARLVDACYGQAFLRTSAVDFLWVAVPYRMTWRYGERGYRYLHLDAGHVAQNLYLAAESIGAGACTVAAFDDQVVNALLGLDGESAFLIYLAAVGKRG